MLSRLTKLLSFSVLATLFFVVVASAQTVAAVNNAADTTESSTSTAVVDDTLYGVETEEVKKMPSQWGLWWMSIKETASELTTFDPVKKAEKRLKFAEQRMKYAEYIAENAKDPKKQAWAEKMIEKANKHMERVEKAKEKWADNPDAKKKLIKNLATFQVRKENYLDRIEEKIPEKRMEQFRKLREKSAEHGKRVMAVLEKRNVPESVKKHVQAVKSMVEKKYVVIKAYNAKRTDLIKKAKDGDTTAKDELKKLNDKRKVELKKTIEQHKKVRANLKAKADEGSVKAQKTLRVLNKVKQNTKAIMEKKKLPVKVNVKNPIVDKKKPIPALKPIKKSIIKPTPAKKSPTNAPLKDRAPMTGINTITR